MNNTSKKLTCRVFKLFILFFSGWAGLTVWVPDASAKAPRLGICSRGILSRVSEAYPGVALTRNDLEGNPFYGFKAGQYQEGGPLQLSILLITSSKVYYYFEPCDICASLWVCEWASPRGLGFTEEVKTAHSIDCEDLPKFDVSEIRYSACVK